MGLNRNSNITLSGYDAYLQGWLSVVSLSILVSSTLHDCCMCVCIGEFDAYPTEKGMLMCLYGKLFNAGDKVLYKHVLSS